MTRRLTIYLAVTFAVTWTFWGMLVPLARAQRIVYGQGPFMLLYALGGLGPTIAAYIAVLATRTQSPIAEFHGRLLRWRLASSWYLLAMGLPPVLALLSLGVTVLLHPDSAPPFLARPWYMFIPLFFFMILGGGLEELGWRGVAQPEMERFVGRPIAAVLVGLAWSAWHLPLFVLPGVSQYRTNFPIFVIHTIGAALMLVWLYCHTRSILLCIAFHASMNATWALGLGNPSTRGSLFLFDACLGVVVGAVLLAVNAAPSSRASGRLAFRKP
jgi:membrane protease YdiL (CAAX protease family)